MLKESMDRKEQKERANLSATIEEDVEVEEEDEGPEFADNETDQRKWCICNKVS